MIKSYSFKIMDERMYLIREGKEAVVVDPFESEEVYADLDGCEKVTIFLTHEHFDHISGVNALKDRFNAQVICTKACGEILPLEENGTRRFPFLFMNDRTTLDYLKENFVFPYMCSADVTFEGQMRIEAVGHTFDLIEFPGHSEYCMVILMDKDKITRFQSVTEAEVALGRCGVKGSNSMAVNNEFEYSEPRNIESDNRTVSSCELPEGHGMLLTGDSLIGTGYELAFPDALRDEYKSNGIPFFESYEATDLIVMPGHGEAGSMHYFLSLVRGYIY